MNATTVGICVGVVAVAIVCISIVYLRKRRQDESSRLVETKEVEELSMPEVVGFFKRPEIMMKLKKSTNNIAVAIKEKGSNGHFRVALCTFNKIKSVVGEPFVVYDANRIDETLQDAFGEKDMIVFQ